MNENIKEKIIKAKEYIGQESKGFIKLLVFSYFLSLFAVLYYFFDLFSHFTLQYIIGGLLLGTGALIGGHKKWAAAAYLVAFVCIIESRINLQEPFSFSAVDRPTHYKLVTYNHNYGRTNFDSIKEWFSDSTNAYDLVVLQEATKATVEMATELSTIYPYQIHEPRDHAFGMVVMSRHPFIESEKILLNGPYYMSFAIRIIIKPDTAENPLTIYALHPYPPVGSTSQAQRDFELYEVAKKVAADQSKNKIMMGDWNITPFAPAYRKILAMSGLHYQGYGFMQTPTWPTFNILKFLKIPIDHVLYSDALIQVKKEAGPAFMSDHHSLIVSLAEGQEHKNDYN